MFLFLSPGIWVNRNLGTFLHLTPVWYVSDSSNSLSYKSFSVTVT